MHHQGVELLFLLIKNKVKNLVEVISCKNSKGYYKKYDNGILELYTNIPASTGSYEPSLIFELSFHNVIGANITLNNAEEPVLDDTNTGHVFRILELDNSKIKVKRTHTKSSTIYAFIVGKWK